jgi:hypothetical protein
MAFGIGQGIVIDPTLDCNLQLVPDFRPRPTSITPGQVSHFPFDTTQTFRTDADTNYACSSVEAKAQETPSYGQVYRAFFLIDFQP